MRETRVLRSTFIALMLALLPGALRAQGPSCDLGRSRQLYSVGGGAVIYLGGPVFTCDNGTTITADSGVYVQSVGRVDFLGNVHFNEADRSLTSQYAQYVGRERRLMAQQDVVLTDKTDGSTLRAISLDYFQKSPTNPDARIEVYAGRPHATLFKKRADNAAVDTTVIDADRMQIIAEKTFRGWGTVDVRRGKLTTKSSYAEFDEAGNFMRLYGQARIQSDTFNLNADSVDADLVNGDTFKEVRARGSAQLKSQDLNVDAPWVRLLFKEGDVERLIAVGGARRANGPQAKTVSPEFTLTADSIDATSPAQKLDRVIAVGRAHGQRAVDSIDAKLPALIAQDWVRGDTVQAYFETTAKDTAQVLKRIVASGAPASSTYRMREKVNDSTEISVNYITARMIDVVMKEGEVDHVRAEGNIQGLYLQPPKRERTQ